jgi:adenine-specific DNA-methyltransferase
MSLELSEKLRFDARSNLDHGKKHFLGQYFTPAPICNFMSSMMTLDGQIKLLDPGCGVGSLTSAIVDRALRNPTCTINADLYDFDKDLVPYLDQVVRVYNESKRVNAKFHLSDFILDKAVKVEARKLKDKRCKKYTHVISNPPYKKLSPSSLQGKSLIEAGLEFYNLYSAFVSLSIALLSDLGELVCIIPRSFCNGPFYKRFRENLVADGAIKRIHIFESRTHAFSVDSVLQENVILHFVKGEKQGNVIVSSSAGSDFVEDSEGKFTATGYSERTVGFDAIINPEDEDLYVHIATNDFDQSCIRKVESMPATLSDLDVQVSTGPVVDFRVKEHLSDYATDTSVPLFFPVHLNGKLDWPKKSKKPNFINLCDSTQKVTWDNRGTYLLVRRFSSKEERRRVSGTIYESSLPYPKIGFDNKVNVFHRNRSGLEDLLAKGLYIYINSTIVDRYFRCFSGHTQINASDLRKMKYPTKEQLIRLGKLIDSTCLSQDEVDYLLLKELWENKG